MTTPHDGEDRDELFASLYGRYYARMLRYFQRVFHLSEADAKELTQDSFVRFYRAMDEYRGDAEWALLEKIAQHVGYNRARSLTTIKRGRIRPESLDEPDARNDPPDLDQRHPIDTMIKTEQLGRMHEAIGELAGGQRQCLQLYLEDLSQEEIARALQISIVAVKSRIRDAKRALRERLGDKNALPEDES
jgi:RNA polymerase sigma-70 factor (ECF subfamily)